MSADLERVVGVLVPGGVRFILIGGWAAALHGSARSTMDVDLVYARSHDNIRALVAALRSHKPYLRGAPLGLPFLFDERTVRMGLNFTLSSELGNLDLLGEVPGGGSYENLLPRSEQVEAFGHRFHVVDLMTLIHLKRAAGRPKDLEPIAELEALLEERRRLEARGEIPGGG
ncbi:MAG TPA: hypothetical protein PK640_00900 [Verrucomicrobiota bacterium]|nr:hypothetical protein [Verrucomicrobiota bacterium]